MRTFVLGALVLGLAVLAVADTASADPLSAIVSCAVSATVSFELGGEPSVTFSQECGFDVVP